MLFSLSQARLRARLQLHILCVILETESPNKGEHSMKAENLAERSYFVLITERASDIYLVNKTHEDGHIIAHCVHGFDCGCPVVDMENPITVPAKHLVQLVNPTR